MIGLRPRPTLKKRMRHRRPEGRRRYARGPGPVTQGLAYSGVVGNPAHLETTAGAEETTTIGNYEDMTPSFRERPIYSDGPGCGETWLRFAAIGITPNQQDGSISGPPKSDRSCEKSEGESLRRE